MGSNLAGVLRDSQDPESWKGGPWEANGGGGDLRAKERSLEQILFSWTSEETHPADPLITDSCPPICEQLKLL